MNQDDETMKVLAQSGLLIGSGFALCGLTGGLALPVVFVAMMAFSVWGFARLS